MSQYQKGINGSQESPFQRQLRMRIETDDPTYPGLKKLKLRGKDLDDLPNCIFQLKELEVLDLSPEREACIDFHIADLPPSIGQLHFLRVLMLDTNSISNLPPEISNLSSLQQLSLSNNFVSELPAEMEKLRNLTSLHLSNNRLETFPEVICSLKQLTHLDISCNQIPVLPDSICHLDQLHTLIATYNRIQVLPEQIGELKKLNLLWIGNNKIKSLPRSIVELEGVEWSSVFMTSSTFEGNPLTKPPLDVCMKGMLAIQEYFQESHRSRK